MSLVLAGHLQPLLVHPDGRVELLGEHGTAVGLVERVELTCTTHRLGPGDTLLLYTDGVTERRRGDEQFGVERLRRAGGAAAGRPAARLLTVGAGRARPLHRRPARRRHRPAGRARRTVGVTA